MKAFTTLDKKLAPLVEYRQFDYWVYEEHRNLLQVVAHLEQVNRHLDPRQPSHRALFIDCAWLYSLSLAHAAQHVRALHVTDVDTALQQYLFGGQMALQEKQKLAAVLQRLAPKGAVASATGGVLPAWYPQLLELLTRHLRRPSVVNDELRYAEWVAEAQLAKESATVAQTFGTAFDPLAAKLVADVCGFLVTVANVDADFRAFARACFALPGDVATPSPTGTAVVTVAGSAPGPGTEGEISGAIERVAGTGGRAETAARAGAQTSLDDLKQATSGSPEDAIGRD